MRLSRPAVVILITSSLLGPALPGPGSALADEHAVLSGRVRDTQGHALADARVTVSGDGIRTTDITTNHDGTYRFPALRPVALTNIRATAPGFRSVEYEGMTLEPGRTRVVDFRLKRPGEREVVILASRDPFPYEDLVRGFVPRLETPVRVVDLDLESDPADAVRRVRAERPNLILGAGLRAARLIRREIGDVPSILTLIDEPRHYDLKAENICFLTNNPSGEDLVRRTSGFLPAARRIGFVYASEASDLLAREVREAAGRRGLEVELRPSYEARDLPETLDRLRGRIDVLLVPYDPLTANQAALDLITRWALTNRIPLAAPTPNWVQRGALFSTGASAERIGWEASRIADQILFLSGNPSQFSLREPREKVLAVNRGTAEALGITVPPSLGVDLEY